MTKMRLLYFPLMLLVIAAMSMPAFGTSEVVSLNCNRDSCAGVSPPFAGATFQVLSIGSSTQDLPYADWLYASADISEGGLLTITEGSAGPAFLKAYLYDVQSEYFPTPPGDNNPDDGWTVDAQLSAFYVDPALIPGCAAPCSGTGSIDLNSILLSQSASLTMNVTIDPAPDPTPEPSSLVLLLLGAVFIGPIIKKRGEVCGG